MLPKLLLAMAVALLNAGTPVRGTTSPTSDAFSVTASGTNRCAFAVIAYDAASGMSVTGVTYGGQAMTPCGTASHNPTSNDYAEVWYLINPPTGSNTLAITVSGTITDIYRNLVSFTGVNQTNPIRSGTYFNHTNAQTFDGSSHYTLVVTSNLNDLTLTCLNGGGNGLTSTNQTSDGISTAGIESFGSDHATAAAASVTHIWTAPAPSGNMAIVGFSINGDLGSAPSSTGTRRVGNQRGPFDQRGFLKAFRWDTSLPASIATVGLPGTGDLQITGQAPAAQISTVAGLGSLVITGQAPLAQISTVAGLGQLTIVGLSATSAISTVPGLGQITIAGQAPQGAISTQPGFAQLLIGGFAPTGTIGQTGLPGTGALLIIGLAPSGAISGLPGTGAILITGFAPLNPVAIIGLPGTGQVVIIGYAPKGSGLFFPVDASTATFSEVSEGNAGFTSVTVGGVTFSAMPVSPATTNEVSESPTTYTEVPE